MPLKIQRVPRGLGEMLSTFGGQTPAELEDRARGVVDLTQFYGMMQRSVQTSGFVAAAASLTTMQAFIAVNSWALLFAASAAISPVNAGTTQLGYGIAIQRPGGPAQLIQSQNSVPVVGSNVAESMILPYPLLLPPGSAVGVLLFSTLGVGTQTGGITADLGILG